MKYIFVVGGVASGLGKGVTASSIGFILKQYGQRIRMRKFEPYLNVDSGTMNPFEHGEVYVTADGGETDLDLGTYERFVGVRTTRGDAVTSGQIWSAVIAAERRGDYLGKTVQIIPHITDEIRRHIISLDDGNTDVAIIEIGGTVGDCESEYFLRAIQRFCTEAECIIVYVALAPVVPPGELKTKPIQHSIERMRGICRPPDIIICRAERELSRDEMKKISLNCAISHDSVFSMPNCESIYDVPMNLQLRGVDTAITKLLGIKALYTPNNIISMAFPRTKQCVHIAVVGKYTTHGDAYLSLRHAIILSAARQYRIAKIYWIEELTRDFRENPNFDLDDAVIAGAIIPGGYGVRGVDALMRSIRFCIADKVPLLGICFGMQLMCIDAFSQRAHDSQNATSAEFDPAAPNPVVTLMKSADHKDGFGGTMRLGEHPVEFAPGSRLSALYGANHTCERFRHRYEVNDTHTPVMHAAGLRVTARTSGRIAGVEWESHPFAVGVQYHPEFTATLEHTSPVIDGLVAASILNSSQS